MTWTLANIRSKVRNITGSPSTNQISDSTLNDYINQFYVYTMPAELKTQIETNFLDFKTVPGQDVYTFPSGYFTDQPGVYADGFPVVFYQDPDVFYQDWPQQYAVDSIGAGDGSTSAFSGTLQNPPLIIGSLFISDNDQVLQSSSAVTTTIATGNGGTAYSGTLATVPVLAGSFSVNGGTESFSDNGNGTLTGSAGGSGTIVYSTGVWALTFNSAVTSGVNISATYTLNSTLGVLSGNGSGTINYTTGAYSVTFASPPASSATVYAKYIGYQGNRPSGCLFFQNEFTLRPVPDQVYQMHLQGFIQPDTLSSDSSTPLQEEWGVYIAYGTALDIFSDRGDLGAYNENYPIFKRYESVAISRTVTQLSSQQSVPRF